MSRYCEFWGSIARVVFDQGAAVKMARAHQRRSSIIGSIIILLFQFLRRADNLCYLKLSLLQILDLVPQLRRAFELVFPRRVAHLLVESHDGLGQFLGAVLFEIF